MSTPTATTALPVRPQSWIGAALAAVGLQAAAAVVLLLLFPLLIVLPLAAAAVSVVLLVLELRGWRRTAVDRPVDPVAAAFAGAAQRMALLANLLVLALAVVAAVGFAVASPVLETVGSSDIGPAAVALALDLAWLRRPDLLAAEQAVLVGDAPGPRRMILTARTAAVAVQILAAAGALVGTVGLLTTPAS